MSMSKNRAIIEELKSRFPHLADEIERKAEAILDAHNIVKNNTAESFPRDKLTLTTLAQSGAIPPAVAKYFISSLDPPEWPKKCDVCGRELKNETEAKAHELWAAAGQWARPGTNELKHPGKSVTDESSRKNEEKYFYEQAEKILRKEVEVRASYENDIRNGMPAERATAKARQELWNWARDKGGIFYHEGKLKDRELRVFIEEVKSEYPTLRPVAPPGYRLPGIIVRPPIEEPAPPPETGPLPFELEEAVPPAPPPAAPPPTPPPAAAPIGTGGLRGRVLDEATEEPIPGARVTVFDVPIYKDGEIVGFRNLETYTDGKGRYEFKEIPLGTLGIGLYNVEAATPLAPPAVRWPKEARPWHAPMFRPFLAKVEEVEIRSGQETQKDFLLELTLQYTKKSVEKLPGGKVLAKGPRITRGVRHYVKPATTKIARFLGMKFLQSAYRDVRRVILGKAQSFYDEFKKKSEKDIKELEERAKDALEAFKRASDEAKKALESDGAVSIAAEIGKLVAAAEAPEAAVFAEILSQAEASAKKYRTAAVVQNLKFAHKQLQDIKSKLSKLTEEPGEKFREDCKRYLDGLKKKEVTIAKRKWKLSEEDAADLGNLVDGDIAEIVEHYARAFEVGEKEYIDRALHAIGYTWFSWGVAPAAEKLRESMSYILKEWWGPIVWMLLYGWGFGSFGLLLLIIWGFLKIQLFSGIAIAWLQIAFLGGGTVLGLVSLPGYMPAEVAPTHYVIIAIIGGLANWLMNIKKPAKAGPLFEGTPFGTVITQLTHFVAGGIIVLGVEMLMISLGFQIPPLTALIAFIVLITLLQMLASQAGMGMEWMPMVMILSAIAIGVLGAATGWFSGLDFALFLIFLMLGMTSFYSQGDMRSIGVLAIGIMIFSYFALGPYAAPIHDATDQLRQPLRMAWSMAKESVSGVWLLLTNPTEYYARQQLLSVRSEKPLSFPQGVEITGPYAVPEGTVPAGQDFSIFLLAENKGDVTAKNVRAMAWCPTGAVAMGGVHCDEKYGRLDPSDIDYLYQSALTEEAKESWWAFFKYWVQRMQLVKASQSLKNRTIYQSLEELNTVALETLWGKTSVYYKYTPIDLMKGQSQRWSFDFTAQGRPENQTRAGETISNKVVTYLEYTSNTSTALAVELASKAELDSRVSRGVTPLYKPVVSLSKATPAQLSLNVGPQPLEASTSEQQKTYNLIVSVTNGRPDGHVILFGGEVGTKITISLSEVIGTGLTCPSPIIGADNSVVATATPSQDGQSVEIKLYPDDPTGRHVIRPYEFKDTFVIVCSFNAKALNEGSVTGLITAQMENYKFALLSSKTVTVGPRLGVFTPTSK